MARSFRITPQKLRRPLSLAVRVALVLAPVLAAGNALAQSSSFSSGTDPVIVDLSVIGDGGYSGGAFTSSAPVLMPGQRLMPGSRAPVSRLYVAPPGGTSLSAPKLKAPMRQAATAQPMAQPKPIKRTPAAPAKQPPQTLTAEAPAPAPMPVKKAPVAMAPKPKPAPPPSVAAAPAPKPITKAKKKAPPPPPAESATAPATPPKTAKAPEPSPPPKSDTIAPQSASLPTGDDAIKAGSKVRVAFGAEDTKLPEEAKTGLGGLAAQLKNQDTLRVQLMAYAGGDALSPSKARRVSLSRALSIRSFLIENGVRSTRIDVRALGSKTTEKPVNRVDVNVVER